jgi:hypothetical protein
MVRSGMTIEEQLDRMAEDPDLAPFVNTFRRILTLPMTEQAVCLARVRDFIEQTLVAEDHRADLSLAGK